MSASETSPLLHTPTAVSQRHRLGPPAIRFPGHGETSSLDRQQSYFSSRPLDDSTTSDASASDATLVTPADRQHGHCKRPHDPRREDSKVYTSFPVPTGTPWREAGTPNDQHEYPFFSRFFGSGKANDNDRHDYPYIQDEEAALGERQPGLPKVTRECLIAEIKCYGTYILPTFLVFVVLVLVVALGIFYHYNKG